MRTHQCPKCDHAPFRKAHGLVVHIARMHKHAMEPATVGSGNSNSTGHYCEHCTHAPFDSLIGLGMHRWRAHGISRKKNLANQRKMRSGKVVMSMSLHTRQLVREEPIILDARVVPVPTHQLKFCPGCAFPVRDLIDGTHTEGSPFKLLVCPCCLFPMDAMLSVEHALKPKLQLPRTRRYETSTVAS